MIIRFFIIFYIAISLTACFNDAQTSLNINSSALAIQKQDVYLGKIIHMKNLLDMQRSSVRLERISEVECGGFFDDEEIIYRFGDFLINKKQGRATVSAIVDNIAHYRIHYGDLIIDHAFNVNKIDKRKYEVVNSNGSSEKYSHIYFIRERKSDDLLVLHYIDNKLIKVENKGQC